MLSQTLFIAACVVGALAQSTTSAASQNADTATATVLIGSVTSGLAGSVVSAAPCGDTTYAFTCTDTDACSGYALTVCPTQLLTSPVTNVVC